MDVAVVEMGAAFQQALRRVKAKQTSRSPTSVVPGLNPEGMHCHYSCQINTYP
jgi:hypothetical protein